MDMKKQNLGTLNDYLKDRKIKLSTATIESYEEQLLAFLEFLSASSPEKLVEKMGPKEVNAYIGHLQTKKTKAGKQLSPFTVGIAGRSIKAFFKWLKKNDYIKKNPLAEYDLPPLPKVEMKTLTEGEINQLLKAIDTHSHIGCRNKLIVLILLDTGLRVSELINTRHEEDVDLVEGVITVIGKGNIQRSVPISFETKKCLKEYLSKHRPCLPEPVNPYLFPGEDDDPISRNGIQQMLHRLEGKAGLQGRGIHPHLFRHTFATMAIAQGADLFVVKDIMGHASLQTTMKYTHLSIADLKAHHATFSPVANLKKGK